MKPNCTECSTHDADRVAAAMEAHARRWPASRHRPDPFTDRLYKFPYKGCEVDITRNWTPNGLTQYGATVRFPLDGGLTSHTHFITLNDAEEWAVCAISAYIVQSGGA